MENSQQKGGKCARKIPTICGDNSKKKWGRFQHLGGKIPIFYGEASNVRLERSPKKMRIILIFNWKDSNFWLE
jgi:hypothetical protein